MRQYTSPVADLQPWQWGELLEKLYVEYELTVEEIAARWECVPSTISRWLKRHGLEAARRGPGTPDELTDEEWLHARYCIEEHNGIEIATELGCSPSAVYRWLKKHSITIRPGQRPQYTELTDKEWLQSKYIDEGMGFSRIARLVGCDERVVRKWISRHDIPTRPQSSGFDNQRENGPAGRCFGPNWEEQRAEALERDGHICRVCGITAIEHRKRHGETTGLAVHHIVPRVEFIEDGTFDHLNANRVENLLTVCLSCHAIVEGKKRDEVVDLFTEPI